MAIVVMSGFGEVLVSQRQFFVGLGCRNDDRSHKRHKQRHWALHTAWLEGRQTIIVSRLKFDVEGRWSKGDIAM